MSTTYFERFEITMTMSEACGVSLPGQDATPMVEELIILPSIGGQLDKIGVDKIREELREYGVWNDEELADDAENRLRILWIAGGSIIEED